MAEDVVPRELMIRYYDEYSTLTTGFIPNQALCDQIHWGKETLEDHEEYIAHLNEQFTIEKD